MEKIKNMMSYLIILTICFYIFPMLIKNTGGGMLILLFIIPLICFITSLVYGIKNGFNLIYFILVMLIFTPTIFIFYNETAYIYIFVYGVIALIGNLIGSLFQNK